MLCTKVDWNHALLLMDKSSALTAGLKTLINVCLSALKTAIYKDEITCL